MHQLRKTLENIPKTKKALFTTLITTYGAKENPHYHDSIQIQLTLDDFFK